MGPDTPTPRDSRSSLTYFTDETLQEKIERHLHDILEADVIQRLQASSSGLASSAVTSRRAPLVWICSCEHVSAVWGPLFVDLS